MKLINRFNGEKMDMQLMSSEERSLWLMKKAIKGFDRCAVLNSWDLSFLTITQSNKSVDDGHRWITSVMDYMKKKFNRRGEKMIYVAVLEIQPKRYEKYGVLAAHWHVAIATSVKGALPHAVKMENGRIKKEREGEVITWDWLYKNVNQKFGMYFCCDCWSRNVYDYLSKYLAKGDLLQEFKKKLGRRVRVFSSSRIDIGNYMSYLQREEYINLIEGEPDFKELYVRRLGSKVNFCAKETIDCVEYDGSSSVKVSYPVVQTIRGELVKESL